MLKKGLTVIPHPRRLQLRASPAGLLALPNLTAFPFVSRTVASEVRPQSRTTRHRDYSSGAATDSHRLPLTGPHIEDGFFVPRVYRYFCWTI